MTSKEEVNLLLFGRLDNSKPSLVRMPEMSNKKAAKAQAEKQQDKTQAQEKAQPPEKPADKETAESADAFGGMFKGSGGVAAARQRRAGAPAPVEKPATPDAPGSASDSKPATPLSPTTRAADFADVMISNVSDAIRAPAGGAAQPSSLVPKADNAVPDFLAMSAPAILPDDIKPEWLPDENFVSA